MRRVAQTALAAVVFLVAVGVCNGITCFGCTVHPPSARSNETARLCSQFDYSGTYHIDCPYSTLCLKRSFQLKLQEGKTVSVSERGCAPQRRNEQVYRDGAWHVENHIEEDAYRVGCTRDNAPGLQAPSEYCYCATHLCNSAESRDYSDTMAVILVFNVLKYIRSLR